MVRQWVFTLALTLLCGATVSELLGANLDTCPLDIIWNMSHPDMDLNSTQDHQNEVSKQSKSADLKGWTKISLRPSGILKKLFHSPCINSSCERFSEFEQLTHPRFKADYFQKHPVLLRTSNKHPLNLRNMLPITWAGVLQDFVQQQKLEFIRVVLNGSNVDASELMRDPSTSTVTNLLSQGYSFSFQAEYLPRPNSFSRLTSSLEKALGVPVSAHGYLSSGGVHVFGPHTDGHDVLVLQLQGAKEWTICTAPWESGTATDRLLAQAMRPGYGLVSPDEELACEAFLLASRRSDTNTPAAASQPTYPDAVYLPAGLVHTAAAEGGVSFSVSLGIHSFGRAWADVVLELVRAVSDHPDCGGCRGGADLIRATVAQDIRVESEWAGIPPWDEVNTTTPGWQQGVRRLLGRVATSLWDAGSPRLPCGSEEEMKAIRLLAGDGVATAQARRIMDMAVADGALARYLNALLQSRQLSEGSAFVWQRRGRARAVHPNMTGPGRFPEVAIRADAGGVGVAWVDVGSCSTSCDDTCSNTCDCRNSGCCGADCDSYCNFRKCGYHGCNTCDCGWTCYGCNVCKAGCDDACTVFGCLPGFAINGGQCAACPAGSYGSSSSCIACLPGKHQPVPQQSSCLACPPGFFQGLSGATDCQLCPGGSYASAGGAILCFECPGGSWCPAGSSAPRNCLQGFFCPAASSVATPCPDGHYCPAMVAGPLLCPPCTEAAGGRGANVGCTSVSEGECASMAVLSPSCGLQECTDVMAGQRGALVAVSSDKPLCDGRSASCGTLRAYLMVAPGGRSKDKKIALLGEMGPMEVANLTDFRITYRVPSNAPAGNNYYVLAEYTGRDGAEYLRGWARSDLFVVRDFRDLVAGSLDRAIAGDDDALLTSLCDDYKAEGNQSNASHVTTLVVYGSMACRCLSLADAGLDCEQTMSTNKLTTQPPSTYASAAQAAISVLAQLQSKQRDDAILRAVQNVASSSKASFSEQFAQVQRALNAMDKAAMLRDLDNMVSSKLQQCRDAEAVLQQLTEEADQLRTNHAEMSSYASTGLAKLNVLTNNLLDRQGDTVRQLQEELVRDIAECESSSKKKLRINKITAGLKAVAGVALMVTGNWVSGGILLAQGVSDFTSQQKVNIAGFAAQLGDWSRKPLSIGECTADAGADCSQLQLSALESQYNSLKAEVGGIFDAKSTDLAKDVAGFIDVARDLLQKTVDVSSCGEAVADAAELNEARRLLGLLGGLNLGLFSLAKTNELGEGHAALIMSGGFPTPQLMHMKIDTSFVSTDIFLSEMLRVTKLDIFSSIRLRELAAQVQSAMEGKVEIEMDYWKLLVKFGNARTLLLRLQDDLRALNMQQMAVRDSLARGQLLPSSMAEVYGVRWAFDESNRITQTANTVRRLLRTLGLVVRYQCVPYAADCYSPDHMPRCGEEYNCLSTALTRISQMSLCCTDQASMQSVVTKTIRADFSDSLAVVAGSGTSRREGGSAAFTVCLMGLEGWSQGMKVNFAAGFVASSTAFPADISVRVTRAGGTVPILPSAYDGFSSAVVSQRAYLSGYNPRTCVGLDPPTWSDSGFASLPPLEGCYAIEFFDEDAEPVTFAGQPRDASSSGGVSLRGLYLVFDVGVRTASPVARPPRASRFGFVNRATGNPFAGCADSTSILQPAGNVSAPSPQPTINMTDGVGQAGGSKFSANSRTTSTLQPAGNVSTPSPQPTIKAAMNPTPQRMTDDAGQVALSTDSVGQAGGSKSSASIAPLVAGATIGGVVACCLCFGLYFGLLKKFSADNGLEERPRPIASLAFA